MNAIVVNPGVIGRTAIIVHEGKCYTATVIDQVAGTEQPKRVRIQCDVTMQGKVLMPGQYVFKDWTEDED